MGCEQIVLKNDNKDRALEANRASRYCRTYCVNCAAAVHFAPRCNQRRAADWLPGSQGRVFSGATSSV
jgi:hypothetical protein